MIFSKPAWRRAARHRCRRSGRESAIFLALLAGLGVFASGCPLRPAQSARTVNWRLVSQVHPSAPQRPVLPGDLPAPPDLAVESPPIPLFSERSVLPPRPQGASSPAGNGTADSAAVSPAAPVLSPELSPGEQSAAQQQAQESLRVAQQHLAAMVGRKLSTTQAELLERVRSFIAQASEALRGGDVLRARNLAQKAELLSFDLIKLQ